MCSCKCMGVLSMCLWCLCARVRLPTHKCSDTCTGTFACTGVTTSLCVYVCWNIREDSCLPLDPPYWCHCQVLLRGDAAKFVCRTRKIGRLLGTSVGYVTSAKQCLPTNAAKQNLRQKHGCSHNGSGQHGTCAPHGLPRATH